MTDTAELIERLREHATDWNGEQMPDLEPAKSDPTAATLRQAATELQRLLDDNERMRGIISNGPSDETIVDARRAYNYKYFGDYELSESQWDAVNTMLSCMDTLALARAALAGDSQNG